MQLALRQVGITRPCVRSPAFRTRSQQTCTSGGAARVPSRQLRAARLTVRAAGASKDEGQVVEFEGAILQDARAGQAGFSTKLKVEKGISEDGAKEGDIVTIEYKTAFINEEGGEAPAEDGEPNEPITFEVGAGDIMGNALFQAFDEAVRGLVAGDSAVVQAKAGEYDKSLLFAVPRGHEEVVRLEEEVGGETGLKVGQIVTLANGQVAILRSVDDEGVIIDCNHPLAGAPLKINLKVLSIDRPAPEEAAAA